MKKLLSSLFVAFVCVSGSLIPSSFASAQNPVSAEAVTVVIQLSPVAGAKADAALAAMNEMRAFIKKQPGFLSSEFVQNINPANSPSHVHVVRWASLKNWEAVFASPEFAKLNASGTKLYTVNASAFKTIK
jgi:heme-degrading monooxygenase HmoA